MKLETSQLVAGYGKMVIIDGISVSFAPAQIAGIIGPNGAGKSTLLKALFGQAKVFSGSISVGEQRYEKADPRWLVKNGVAYVPQLHNVFPSLTVRENLEIGTYVRATSKDLDRVLELFPPLRNLLKRHAGKLSGGERNMVAVARALMSDPHVVLVDEPSAGLAPQVAHSLWEDLRRLSQTGIAVVGVEQNVSLALQFSDVVHVLVGGRISASGSPKDFGDAEKLTALFVGQRESARREVDRSIDRPAI